MENNKNNRRDDEFYFRTRGMTVGYRGVPLIRDIEIGVRRGEILTLIGPNGAGKTTILRSIIRQLDLLGGAVYIDGRDAAVLSANEFARQVSVVLTERIRAEGMTCEEVVSTGRYPYTGRLGVLSANDKQIVREAMEQVRVEDLAERPFSQISDGQRQRVMLARALCQEPQVLILDEPTSYLDIRYKLEFLSVLQKMTREKNLTVILSLHELDLAARVSDQIACVKGDAIDRYGTPEEIFRDGYIRELYGMTDGTYDERSGQAELRKPEGKPEVFVLAGCGTGTPIFRRLQREGRPFAAGIIWENDLDYPAAKALAADGVYVPAFSALTDGQIARAKALAAQCREVICTLGQEQMCGAATRLKEIYVTVQPPGDF